VSDIRYAFRSLAQRPLLTAVAVLSLALGIGVNVAIFSMFEQLLLRRLPVPAPDEIVLVTSPGPHPGGRDTSNAGGTEAIFSYPLFRDLERLQTGALRLAAHRDFGAHLAYRGQTSVGVGALVSGQYFSVLGISPALGRLFGPEDDRVPNGHPIVILSYDYWNTHFGADPRVVNETLVVNGQLMTIVGVTPRRFTGTTIRDAPQVYIPLAMARLAFRDLTSRNMHWLYAFGRLAPGVSRERAEAVANLPFAALIRDVELPALGSGMGDLERQQFQQRTLVLSDGSLPRARDRSAIRAMAVLLLLVAGFVLAIACANVANLLLARVSDRAIEMSVRLSLGASEGQVIRLVLIEVLLLGVLGSAGALVVAKVALDGIVAIMPPEIGLLFNFEINATMLTFALTTGLVTSLLFGLFPAVHGVRVTAAAGLHTHSSRMSGSRAANRFRTSMATSQVALTTTLLAVAGLFVVSLVNISRVELGIRREGLVTFRVSPSVNGYTSEQARTFFARIEDELRGLPGVSSVTASTVSILSNDSSGNFLTVEGFEATPETDTNARYGRTSVDYFRTLGIPLLAGREFTTADNAASPHVAVVNEAFARKFNLGSRTVGTRMALGRGNRSLDIEIVGLVRDAKYSEVKDPPPAQFYLPYRQADVGSLTFYVRGGTDTRPLVGMIPSVIGRLDANLPIESLRTMDDHIWERTTPDRILTTLSFAFAGLALVMAAIGVYAVLAYGVAQRLREIGIRMALGAKPRDVRALVLSHVGRMTLVGGTVGAVLAFGLGRLGQGMLFGVEGTDAGIIGAAALVVVVVALAAGVLPARHAASVNPIDALRVD